MATCEDLQTSKNTDIKNAAKMGIKPKYKSALVLQPKRSANSKHLTFSKHSKREGRKAMKANAYNHCNRYDCAGGPANLQSPHNIPDIKAESGWIDLLQRVHKSLEASAHSIF